MTKLQIENTAFATQVFTYPYLDPYIKCGNVMRNSRKIDMDTNCLAAGLLCLNSKNRLSFKTKDETTIPSSKVFGYCRIWKCKNTKIYLLMQCKSSLYTTSKDRLSIHKNV